MPKKNTEITRVAHNTVYFKAFNSDYRVGGCYHGLDNASHKAIVTLQSYADSHGWVCRRDGKGYGLKELSEMFDLNYRTTKRVLMILEGANLIKVLPDGAIEITYFLFSQTDRDYGASLASKQRDAIERSIVTKASREAAEKRVDEMLSSSDVALSKAGLVIKDGQVVRKATGEIISEAGGQNDG